MLYAWLESQELIERFAHQFTVGFDAGPNAKVNGRLISKHSQAIQYAATTYLRFSDKLGLRWVEIDVSYDHARRQRVDFDRHSGCGASQPDGGGVNNDVALVGYRQITLPRNEMSGYAQSVGQQASQGLAFLLVPINDRDLGSASPTQFNTDGAGRAARTE
jgi:hypothetical protein